MTATIGDSVAVCIVTRQRPEQLTRLLNALADCTEPMAMCWRETIVVDNDPMRSAELPVEMAGPTFPTTLRYVVEPTPGVAAARNAAISAASTQHVAFIDDDMTPSPDWLGALTRGVVSCAADAAIGPVIIRFESTPPAGLAESRALDFPQWTHGHRIDTVRTGNVILDRSVLPDQPFDHRLSTSGGEDHMLGRQLAARGANIVFLDDAEAAEWTPADRLTRSALTSRQRRMGFAYTNVDLTLADHDRAWRIKATHLATGLARFAVGSLLSLPILPHARRWRGHQLRWFAIGQLSALRGESMRYYE